MLFKVSENTVKTKDWVPTVLNDLAIFAMKMTSADIQKTNKTQRKYIVKIKVKEHEERTFKRTKYSSQKVKNATICHAN